MKRLLRWLTVTVCITMLLNGCASNNWQTVVGKSLGTIAQSVDSAMKGWATYVVMNNVPDSDQQKVRNVYLQYQVAMQGAQRAYGAAVTANDQSIVTQAMTALSAAQSQILTLVSQLSNGK
jgi:hypothetical protein